MKRGSGWGAQLVLFGIAMLAASEISAQTDPCLALSVTQNVDSNLFLLRFGGEFGVPYCVEFSSDLQNWSPIWTNAGPALADPIRFNVTNDQTFYRVSRGPLPMFMSAITCKSNLSLQGASLYVDSYDSLDPLHSTNGLYDFDKRKAGGDVNVGGFTGAQNCIVKGKVYETPPGTIMLGPLGSIGDLDWNTPGIEPGWYLNDFNFCMPEVTPPYQSGIPLTKQSFGTNTYILGNASYFVAGDFNLTAAQTLYVAGQARLYVTGNFTMLSPSSSYLTIAPGSGLKLYVGSSSVAGVSATLSRVINPNSVAGFQYYGLPSNTNLTWTTAPLNIGCIYAPNAKLTLSTGGVATNDLQGALVGKSILLNGYYQCHFDENLKRMGPTR